MYNNTERLENYFQKLPLFIQEHSVRVGTYARLLTEQMQYIQKDNRLPALHDMEILGRYHDIGKIGVASEIWEKPMPLSLEEQKIIHIHTVIGAYIVEEKLQTVEREKDSSDFHVILAQCCLYHHERWDGTGYPFGYRSDSIPVHARIISVADAFDAMTADRPYHRGIHHNFALKEIHAAAGAQFDPVMAELFCSMMQKYTSDKVIGM